MKYLVVIEKSKTGFGAFAPDLPGCVSTGKTRPVVIKRMQEAIAFHLDGLRRDGLPIPKPSSDSTFIDVSAA